MEELNRRVRADLAKIQYATRDWSFPRQHDGENVLDVAIIGAGQGGIATCFGLKRRGISNTCMFDMAPKGGEGPWITFARMITLRTPKYVTGPDLGIPSLTPQSWYEAKYGEQAWRDLNKIPRQDWQAYLDWLRDVLELPVRNEHQLVDMDWQDGLVKLTFTCEKGVHRSVWSRKVVLATGIQGGGEWYIPPFISGKLPKTRYAHTSEPIDFEQLRGKRIGVLGAGASAFDNAATALETGALRVDLCLRRKKIPSVNPYRWMENSGFLSYFSELPDLIRWRFMRRIYDLNQPPPQDTFWRCRSHENFAFHTGTPWDDVREEGNDVVVSTPQGDMRFDFLIIGTGFQIDMSLRPELAKLAPHIALWRDRFAAPDQERSDLLGSYPYLGSKFQFLPKDDGDPMTPLLSAVHNFTFSATPSMGLSGSSVSAMRFGVEKLSFSIGRDLFVADGEQHLQSLLDYNEDELVDLEPPG
ncbi:NAD(P)-binding domain-containing protein [Acetobacter conturbans]|uniref:SidA/IucD/PvdA family monooxygenase n=1 Tax=Acetobacter conturbans TaxID=1737472 RepID=A0ABX0JWQ1_9PROT|nr:NAD(P)/FAD-dependent oxidoreductase [Acetobacter conturbans]NHN87405.1 SidA/IucD/PvdA family monooxygenase [Acetobacter conturbans]